MLTALKLYDGTNQGLDIILSLVPHAQGSVDAPKKAFKYRPDEKEASAYLLPPSDKHPYWRFVDYGISQHAFSPIDLYMREKNMVKHQFTYALYELANFYGVEDEKLSKVNRPEWHDRPIKEGEKEGQRVFETRDTFTDAEIHLWGPNVTEKELRTYGWSPVLYVGTVRNGQVKECRSTETYPIFVQKCNYIDEEGRQLTFHKVYKPREYNKRFRFEYIGQPPKNYIYGLEALRCAYRKNGEVKLEQLFLVSGGSDGANCLSMGGQAVWLNSETADLTAEQHDLLLKYAKRIYYIGDVDTTGKECARRLALRYLDIYTVWLPEKHMNQYRDNRGNKRKDLKDYVQLFPSREDFWQLVHKAQKAQFWCEEVSKNRDGETKVSYHLSPVNLSYFLELNGYYTLHDKNRERPHYIKIDGWLVEDVSPQDIRNFLNEWCDDNALPVAVQNLVRRSKDLPNKEISNLRQLTLDFSTGTSDMQLVFCRNGWVEVNAKDIVKHQYNEPTPLNSFVWRSNVIDHDYVKHAPMFEIVEYEDGTYGARIADQAESDMLTYLRNTSRLHWRQVDEQGIALTPEQIVDEEKCLAAKIACIGYYLHHYRVSSFAQAAILMDSFLPEDEREANGRSGKSIFMRFLMKLNNTFFIDGRNPDIDRNKFLFDGVTLGTTLVAVDDCYYGFPFSVFFGKITGSFHFEGKNDHPVTIDAEQAPKMLFSSNYVIKDNDSSTEARLWAQIFSDYYHKMVPGKNDYQEDRSVNDTFGYDLIEPGYPEEKWQADIAFALQCLQFYLSLPVSKRKIMPPMDCIKRRTQRANVGKAFEEWAENYYQIGGGHLDITEDYDSVLADYRRDTEDIRISPQTFTRRLKEYCMFAKHILCYNPAELTEDKKEGGRIRMRMPGNSSAKIQKIHVRSNQYTYFDSNEVKPDGDLPF